MLNNDNILPVTPSMERFTIQANAFTAACEQFALGGSLYALPQHTTTTTATFVVFVNTWMENNEHDELGNYADLVEMAVTPPMAKCPKCGASNHTACTPLDELSKYF